MGKCAVCGKEAKYCFLFVPSDIFAYLCDYHFAQRINDSDKPITQWIDEQKSVLDFLKSYKPKNKGAK